MGGELLVPVGLDEGVYSAVEMYPNLKLDCVAEEVGGVFGRFWKSVLGEGEERS